MDWLAPFLEGRPEGLYAPAFDAFLDPVVPVRRAILSRARADRAVAEHGEIWATASTLGLLRRLHPRWNGDAREIDPATPLIGRGATLELFESGYLLGSVQTRLSDGAASLLCTGHFNRQAGRTTNPAPAPRACVLLIEAMFGLPVFRFPPRLEIEARLIAFCREAFASNQTPILLADALGKTQEAAAILERSEIPSVWHGDSWRLLDVYAAAGFRFALSRSLESGPPQPGEALLVPPRDARSQAVRQIRKRKVAYLSGWAIRSAARADFDADLLLPFSANADFAQLREHVTAVQPERLVTRSGYAPDFARILRDRGVAAQAMAESQARVESV